MILGHCFIKTILNTDNNKKELLGHCKDYFRSLWRGVVSIFGSDGKSKRLLFSLHPFQTVLLFLDLWNLAVAAVTCWGDTWAPERFQARKQICVDKTLQARDFFTSLKKIVKKKASLGILASSELSTCIPVYTLPLSLQSSFSRFLMFRSNIDFCSAVTILNRSCNRYGNDFPCVAAD